MSNLISSRPLPITGYVLLFAAIINVSMAMSTGNTDTILDIFGISPDVKCRNYRNINEIPL